MPGLTPEQIAERRQGIGGTDALRIVQGEWRQLYREKMGLADPDDLSGVLAVQMGIHTEPFNREWFTRVTGRAVTGAGRTMVSDDYPFMRMNADGFTRTSQGHLAYWDAKHVGRWGEAELLRYTPQMTHNATVAGVDWWIISAFVGNSRHEIAEQPVDPIFRARLVALEREFWSFVERGEEPEDRADPAAVPKPRPKLREILLDLTPADERPNWAPDFARLARTFAETDGFAKVWAITRKEMIELVPEDVGLVTLGLVRYKRDGRGVTIALDKPKETAK